MTRRLGIKVHLRTFIGHSRWRYWNSNFLNLKPGTPSTHFKPAVNKSGARDAANQFVFPSAASECDWRVQCTGCWAHSYLFVGFCHRFSAFKVKWGQGLCECWSIPVVGQYSGVWFPWWPCWPALSQDVAPPLVSNLAFSWKLRDGILNL